MVNCSNPIEDVISLLLIGPFTEIKNFMFDSAGPLTMTMLVENSSDRMYSKYLASCCLNEMSNSR